MNFKDYQRTALETACYADVGSNYNYPALGLAGEAGEVCNKIKKIERDHDGVITKDMKCKISDEIGDVLWYLAMLSHEFGLSLQNIAESNIYKLNLRAINGKIKGFGDQR